MRTTQTGSHHTTIPPVYTNYNNGSNTNYNGALNHTECTNVIERKTTPIIRSLLHTLPYRAPEFHIVHNYSKSTCRSCFPVCVDYVPTHTTNLVTCAHRPFFKRTILLAFLWKLLTIYQDYLNKTYLSTNVLNMYNYNTE